MEVVDEVNMATSVKSCDKSADVPDSPLSEHSWKDVPRGRPKSGRMWKEPRSVGLSKVTKSKPLKTSWEKKMKERAEKKSVKELERNLKSDIKKKLEEKRKRQEQRAKQQLEKDRKSEVVQVVKNTAKIKRMKKKQLRQIKKI